MTSIKLNQSRFISPSNAVIVFFDLEYYVPLKNRSISGMGLIYDPHVAGNFLIGGCAYTLRVADLQNNEPPTKIASHWGKSFADEKKVVTELFKVLKHALKMNKRNKDQFSPLLCGIGIIHSDWPALLSLFVKYGLVEAGQVFKFQSQFRTLDLQIIGIPFFKSKHPLLYPKKKSELVLKFLNEKPDSDGKEVWSMFDDGMFDQISIRTEKEVKQTLRIYQKLFSEGNDLLIYKKQWLKSQRDSGAR